MMPSSTPESASAAHGDAIGYTRVSHEEQARGDKTSLAHQRARIEQLATDRQCRLIKIFEDPGVSGGTAEDRPGFMALVAYCRANPRTWRDPGYVFVYNDSRWGRFTDPEEATFWRVRFRKEFGWIVRFTEGDETEDPTARGVIRALHSAQATAYREQVKQNAKQGARGTAAQGYWQNEAPLGYRRLAMSKGGRQRVLDIGQRKALDERVRLTKGPPEEVAVVQWMFAAYADGEMTLGQMARALEAKWPERKWSRRTVQQVLRNQAYVGDVVWCRRPHDKQERRETPVRDRDDWVVAPDAHEALVRRELFHRVEDRLEQNRKSVRAPASDYLLSGLITCAQCGEPYVGSGGRRGPPTDPERYRIYRDRGSDRRRGACRNPIGTIRKHMVEPMVLDAIAQVVEHPEIQSLIEEEVDRVLSSIRESHIERRDVVDVECNKLKTERGRLVDAVARGTLADEEVRVRMEHIRDRLEHLSTERQQLRFEGRRSSDIEEEKAHLMALAADFGAQAERLSGQRLRDLVRPWLERAVFDKHKRRLTLTIRRVPGLRLCASLTSPGRG